MLDCSQPLYFSTQENVRKSARKASAKHEARGVGLAALSPRSTIEEKHGKTEGCEQSTIMSTQSTPHGQQIIVFTMNSVQCFISFATHSLKRHVK